MNAGCFEKNVNIYYLLNAKAAKQLFYCIPSYMNLSLVIRNQKEEATKLPRSPFSPA